MRPALPCATLLPAAASCRSPTSVATRRRREHAAAALQTIDAQEMRVAPPHLMRPVYERWAVPVELRTDPPTTAVCLAYVADRSNPQGYAGTLTLDQQAAIITRAAGLRGPNHEYVLGMLGPCSP